MNALSSLKFRAPLHYMSGRKMPGAGEAGTREDSPRMITDSGQQNVTCPASTLKVRKNSCTSAKITVHEPSEHFPAR
jgi:hypothetical protein